MRVASGFLPMRRTGHSILAHLEIIALYQRTQQPGVILFLDFEKAFDRLDRPWLERCMAATGFGAYCRSRSQPEQPTLPAHIAARVISAARNQMRSDWLLVGSDIRLRAGVLSHWLRGRQPSMTAEAFQSRWCHGEVLCSRPAEEQEPPHMHWSAAHPVPLPI